MKWARVNTWTNSAIVATGDYYVTAAGTLYLCTTPGGTSGSSTGPSGTGTGITDGTAVWSSVTTAVPPQWESVTNLAIGIQIDGIPNGKQITLGRLRIFNCHPRVPDPNTVSQDTAAPTSGQWYPGDTVWNTAPSAGGVIGWVCVTAGSPGTWKSFGTIST